MFVTKRDAVLFTFFVLFLDNIERMMAQCSVSRYFQKVSNLSRSFRFSPARSYSGIVNDFVLKIVYTYGIGSIGALGHNDYDDREYPTVVSSCCEYCIDCRIFGGKRD